MRKHEPGQGEVPEVVRAELHLEAVDRATEGQRHHACAVHEQVDRAVRRGELVGERAHRGEVGEVEPCDLELGAGYVAAHPTRGILAARGIAHGEDHGRAGARELPRGDEPDAAAGATYHREATLWSGTSAAVHFGMESAFLGPQPGKPNGRRR